MIPNRLLITISFRFFSVMWKNEIFPSVTAIASATALPLPAVASEIAAHCLPTVVAIATASAVASATILPSSLLPPAPPLPPSPPSPPPKWRDHSHCRYRNRYCRHCRHCGCSFGSSTSAVTDATFDTATAAAAASPAGRAPLLSGGWRRG